MSEYDQPEVPATEFGDRLRQERDAHLQASAKQMNDMFSAAGQDAHRATSAQLRAGQQGLYPHMTPQELGAAVAARQAVVGSAYGGRPLERLGGTFDHSDVGCSPAPPRADMRHVNDPPGLRPTGESAWETWKRGQR